MNHSDFIYMQGLVAGAALAELPVPRADRRIMAWDVLGAVERLCQDRGGLTSEEASITWVLDSLARRGFYTGPDHGKLSEQLDAVLEELGEVARMLRRASQGKPFDPDEMIKECCDVVIAAICLGGRAAGGCLPLEVAQKCLADEKRGYLHGILPAAPG